MRRKKIEIDCGYRLVDFSFGGPASDAQEVEFQCWPADWKETLCSDIKSLRASTIEEFAQKLLCANYTLANIRFGQISKHDKNKLKELMASTS